MKKSYQKILNSSMKIQRCLTEINYILKYTAIIFHITVFLYFWTDKYSLDEQKRLH